MIKSALIWFLFLTRFFVDAQTNSADNLEFILKSSRHDTSRVNTLNQLSILYLTNNPSRALAYANEALTLAQSLQFTSGEITALNRVGENEFRQSNYAKAVDYTTQSLRLAEKIKDSLGMAKAYRVLGIIYTYGLKQYDIALQYQLNALSIFSLRKDKRNMAAFYGNITWIYASMNQNLVEAHRLALLGLRLAKEVKDNQLISYNYNSLGLIFLQEGQLDSAIWYIDRSIEMAKLVKDRTVIAYDKIIKGNAYLHQKNYSLAIEVFQEAAKEGRELKMDELLKDASEGLAKSYEAQGNYPLAYQNYILTTRLKDSLVNWATTQKILLTKLEFEEEKREAKIVELEKTNQYAQNEKLVYIVLFGVTLLSMVVVVALVTRNNYQRKITNRLLIEKNIEIEFQNNKLKDVNSIKDKFFSIIGHDLRSPLVSLKGLLGLVNRNEISDQEFKHFAPKLYQHVIGVSETLENLLQWSRSQMEGWSHVPAILHLHQVIDKSVKLFYETANEKKITIENYVDPAETVYADENQAELIFRNLIHNAIKFTPEGGRIELTSKQSGEFIEVSVIDTGTGMSGEHVSLLFQKTTNTTRGTQGEKGTGLGLLLCIEMVKNNGGKISVTSAIGKGSTFHVLLKKNEPKAFLN